jgi:hypothetical protein
MMRFDTTAAKGALWSAGRSAPARKRRLGGRYTLVVRASADVYQHRVLPGAPDHREALDLDQRVGRRTG